MAKKAVAGTGAKKPAKRARSLEEVLIPESRRRAVRLYVEGASVESIASELGLVPNDVQPWISSPKVERMREARAAKA
jgi:transposase-like protein